MAYSTEQIRTIVARVAVRRLQARGVRQGTLEWTVEYRAELDAAVKEFTPVLNPPEPATNAEIMALTPRAVADAPAHVRKELRRAYLRRDMTEVRRIVGTLRGATDDPPEAA